jgi:hypothetical protein
VSGDDGRPTPEETAANRPAPDEVAYERPAPDEAGFDEAVRAMPALDARARAAVEAAHRAVALRHPGGAEGPEAVVRHEAGRRRRVAVIAVACVLVIAAAAVLVSRRLGHTDVSTTSSQGLPYLVPTKVPDGLALKTASARQITGQGRHREIVVGETLTADDLATAPLALIQIDSGATGSSSLPDTNSAVFTNGHWVQLYSAAGGSTVAGAAWKPDSSTMISVSSVRLTKDQLLQVVSAVSGDAPGSLAVDTSKLPHGFWVLSDHRGPKTIWTVAYQEPTSDDSTATTTDGEPSSASVVRMLTVLVTPGDLATLAVSLVASSSSTLPNVATAPPTQVDVNGRSAWLTETRVSEPGGRSGPTSQGGSGPTVDSASVSWVQDGAMVSVTGNGLTKEEVLTAARSLRQLSSSEAGRIEATLGSASPPGLVVAVGPGDHSGWQIVASTDGSRVAAVAVQRQPSTGAGPGGPGSTVLSAGCSTQVQVNSDAATLLGAALDTCGDPPILLAAVSDLAGDVDVTLPDGTAAPTERVVLPPTELPPTQTSDAAASVSVVYAVLPAGTTSVRLVVKGRDGKVRVDTEVSG